MSKSFADLGISKPVAEALARQGIIKPFAIQSLVVPDALAGHDVLAESPTGSGKTLAFAAPLVDRIDPSARRPAVLVLAPTRELAAQIVEETTPLAKARGLRTLAVFGGVGIQPQIQRAPNAHFLVATPGRLLDLLDRRALRLEHVQAVVLDEADRMLDMGFRPDVERILRATPTERQTLLFSATLAGDVDELARRHTRNARRHSTGSTGRSRPDIEHRFIAMEHSEKVGYLVRELRSRDGAGRALVFVRTRRGADRLVKRLAGKGVRSAALHGGKTQGNRTRTLGQFESGRVDALIATDVAARGIDVRGISHVINYDAPEDRESYVHRIGRTARAGDSGVGVTFVIPDQVRDVGAIARQLELRNEFRDSGLSAEAPSHGSREAARSHSRGTRASGNRRQSEGSGRRRNRAGSR